MAMTPLRWRRRMREISSSIGSSTLVPGDLRIRLPHVVRANVIQPVEVFTLEAGDGQLHERCGGRESVRRRGELDMASRFLQLPTVHQGTVPDQQDILRTRNELGRESR